MGKWAFEFLAELFLKNEKASDDRTFFTQCVRYHSPEVKKFHQVVICPLCNFLDDSQIFTIVRSATLSLLASSSESD